MLGARLICGDKGQIDVRLHGAGEFTLGLFTGFFEALQGHFIAAQVDALIFFELGSHIINDVLVEVLTTEEGITVSRFDFEYAITQFEDGDIEGTATEVKNGNFLFALFVQTIGQRSGSRLVDDTQNFKTCDLSGVLSGLTLGVVKVSRNGNDRFGYRFAQVVFGSFLHLLQDHGRNFRRAVFFASGFNPGITVVSVDDTKGADIDILAYRITVVLTANQAFDGEQCILRVGHRLAFSLLTDQPLTALGKGDHGRRGPVAFCIGDDDGLATFHDSNT